MALQISCVYLVLWHRKVLPDLPNRERKPNTPPSLPLRTPFVDSSSGSNSLHVICLQFLCLKPSQSISSLSIHVPHHYTQSKWVVLNSRLPVSVTPLPGNLFREILSATRLNSSFGPRSFLTEENALTWITPATKTMCISGHCLRICFTNCTNVFPVFTTESTSTRVFSPSRSRGLRSVGSFALLVE